MLGPQPRILLYSGGDKEPKVQGLQGCGERGELIEGTSALYIPGILALQALCLPLNPSILPESPPRPTFL